MLLVRNFYDWLDIINLACIIYMSVFLFTIQRELTNVWFENWFGYQAEKIPGSQTVTLNKKCIDS